MTSVRRVTARSAAVLAGMMLVVAAAPAPAALAKAVNVSALDNRFQPTRVTVGVGITVTWTNDGQSQHTVTADDGSFDSGTLDPGESFSVTFDEAGTFPYHCAFHGGAGGVGMAGVVVVRSAAVASSSPRGPALARTGAGPGALALAGIGSAIIGLALLRRARRPARDLHR